MAISSEDVKVAFSSGFDYGFALGVRDGKANGKKSRLSPEGRARLVAAASGPRKRRRKNRRKTAGTEATA